MTRINADVQVDAGHDRSGRISVIRANRRDPRFLVRSSVNASPARLAGASTVWYFWVAPRVSPAIGPFRDFAIPVHAQTEYLQPIPPSDCSSICGGGALRCDSDCDSRRQSIFSILAGR